MNQHFVVSGCGRSGTMFTWRLLNWIGVRTSFEEFFDAQSRETDCAESYVQWLEETGTAGEVSSLSPPHVANLAEHVTIIHIVRNPVAVIASLLGGKNFEKPLVWSKNVKFNFRFAPEMKMTMTPLEMAMTYWLRWNELVEDYADLRVRAEDLGDSKADTLPALMSTIDSPLDPSLARAAREHLGTTWNAGNRDQNLRWSRIPDSIAKRDVCAMAFRFGYSEMDLREHCPHCGMIAS